jgi:hypothetical protein
VGYSTQLVILLDNLAAASLLASYRPTLHRHGLSESFGQLATQWLEAPSILTGHGSPFRSAGSQAILGLLGTSWQTSLRSLGPLYTALTSPHPPHTYDGRQNSGFAQRHIQHILVRHPKPTRPWISDPIQRKAALLPYPICLARDEGWLADGPARDQ